MAGSRAVRHQCRQARPDQAGFLQILGPIGTLQPAALGALLGEPTIFFDADENDLFCHLLYDLVGQLGVDLFAATARAAITASTSRVVD